MPEPSATIDLTPCQHRALDVLHRQGNVFLTGAAGTGKSFLLSHFLKDKAAEDFPIVASTGAAAVIVGGRTFHSFFGLGILEGGVEATIARAIRNRKLLRRLNRAYCVIIDEVSMLSGAMLEAADAIARRARGSREPWGGLRIIAVGDFAQLPPVTQGNQLKDWAFRHPVWNESGFVPALLSTVMRTQDDDFLAILNHVREGTVNERVAEFLESRKAVESEAVDATRLYPHRAQAEAFNLRRLEAIPRNAVVFPTQYEGDERYVEAAKRMLPIPEQLALKVGALVMMRRNDILDARYVNGSLGFIKHIGEDLLRIDLLSGTEIEIGVEKFTSLDGDGREVAAAYNFPVTLAWATTIHKAQGASLDRMIVDLSHLWEPGQAYVALSRVRSAAGLFVERWHPSSIRAEPLVTAFYDGLAEESAKYVPRPLFHITRIGMPKVAEPEKKKKTGKGSRQERAAIIARLLKEKVPLEQIARTATIKPDRVLLYIEKLLESGTDHDLAYLTENIPELSRIETAFEEYGLERLKPVYEALDEAVPYDTLKLVRCVMRGR